MPTINFNGKTYNNIEEMPANERQAFEKLSSLLVDANGNGIPDLLEGDMVQNVMAVHATKTSINVNGQTYHSLEDLPPDLRQSVDGAFQFLSKMGIANTTSDIQTPAMRQEAQPKSKPFLAQESPSAIEEESGRSTFSIVLISIVLCFAVVAATIAIFVFINR
ncbi:MAG TPA: hypothetical protein PKI33_01380 [Anaerolineales bacterium]|nr:hypothetical protein [Anaerolineales bacterium]